MNKTAVVCALIIAIGAASTASAAKLITGGQIKNGSIGLADLSRRARRALSGQDGRDGTPGSAGPTGAPGPQGPAGAQGPAGPQALGTVVRSADFEAPAYDFARGAVTCPAGMVALGGSLSPGGLSESYDWPTADGRGWEGSALETVGFEGFTMRISVVCAPGSAQVAAAQAMSLRSSTHDAEDAERQTLRAAQAAR